MKSGILLLLCSAAVFGQLPTTTLTTANLSFPAYNQLEFELYMKNTSPGTIEYAGGQFHFSFNKAILNGGTGVLTILSSGLGNLAPKNPTVLTSTTPGQLRTAMPTPPGAGNGLMMQKGSTFLVARFRLSTSAAAFATVQPDIFIRSSASGNPFTKFGAYINQINTEIQNASIYYDFIIPYITVSTDSLTQICVGDSYKNRFFTVTNTCTAAVIVRISDSLNSTDEISKFPNEKREYRFWQKGDSPWLSINPPGVKIEGGHSSQITLTFNPQGLAWGSYKACLRIEGPANTKYIAVQMKKFLADNLPPSISFIPLNNTKEFSNRVLMSVAVADSGNGLEYSVANRPRLYYKRSRDANAFGGNTDTSNGWKWNEAMAKFPKFSFLLDYAKLFGGGVTYGDTIQYFVAAQDRSATANVGAYPSRGFAASSVSAVVSAPFNPAFYTISGFTLLEYDEKVIITDANGHSATLYGIAVAQTEDEFPAVAAADGFDVRFAGNKRAEVLSGNRDIIIRGAAYPVTLRVEGVSLHVRDKATGGKIVNQLLRSGQNLTISDASVNIIEVSSTDQPASFSLHQNYPNPFNASTLIHYELDEPGPVRLSVFSTLGEEVQELADGYKPAGKHTVAFNAASLPGGVYFYALNSRNKKTIKKMVYLK